MIHDRSYYYPRLNALVLAGLVLGIAAVAAVAGSVIERIAGLL